MKRLKNILWILFWVGIGFGVNISSYNQGYNKGCDQMFYFLVDTITKTMNYTIENKNDVGIIEFEGDTNRYIIKKKDLNNYRNK